MQGLSRRQMIALAGTPCLPADTGSPRTPNILFILADDMSWADLGCYGNPFIETPNLDRLAREGLRFTSAYAASPVCAPTRAALISGLYPARIGIHNVPNPPHRPWARLLPPPQVDHLPDKHDTIALRLSARNYVSTLIGKWHLDGAGDAASRSRLGPAKRGFLSPPAIEAPGKPGGLMGRIESFAQANPHKGIGNQTLQAARFFASRPAAPFFCFLSLSMPHLPVEARQELVAKYEAKAKRTPPGIHPAYAAMVETIDESVGLLLEQLDELGLAGATAVFFTSDNGGVNTLTFESRVQLSEGGRSQSYFTVVDKPRIFNSNAPLRSEKGSLYEGGLRVPLVVRWPGAIRAASICDVPVISMDLHATWLDMAGVRDAGGPERDGRSLLPLFAGNADAAARPLFWHYPCYHHSTPASAVRDGKWKLIEFFEGPRVELYDLEADPGESRDMAARMPERVETLRGMLRQWRSAVGAAPPAPNPDHRPEREKLWAPR